jgi:hypothetical protein
MTALEIIQWLKEDGHINNKQAGILRRAILDRPEGRWEAVPVNEKTKWVIWKCSNCQSLADNATTYCPWCSADMRSKHAKEGDKILGKSPAQIFMDEFGGEVLAQSAEKKEGGKP